MNNMPHLQMKLDEIGRGTMTIDGHPIPSVVAARIEIAPGSAFVTCTMKFLCELDVDIALHETGLEFAVLGDGDGEQPDADDLD